MGVEIFPAKSGQGDLSLREATVILVSSCPVMLSRSYMLLCDIGSHCCTPSPHLAACCELCKCGRTGSWCADHQLAPSGTELGGTGGWAQLLACRRQRCLQPRPARVSHHRHGVVSTARWWSRFQTVTHAQEYVVLQRCTLRAFFEFWAPCVFLLQYQAPPHTFCNNGRLQWKDGKQRLQQAWENGCSSKVSSRSEGVPFLWWWCHWHWHCLIVV